MRKKPDPEVYPKALRVLDIDAADAVAIEDAPAGVAAARAAGVAVVTRSVYFAASPIAGAIAIGPGLHSRSCWLPALPKKGADDNGRVDLAALRAWHAQGAGR